MLGILGTTALLLDGGPDDTWGKPRERAVLATLLVHANEVVPLDELVRWVWPRDKPVPLQLGATFDTYVARIRRTLARLPSPPELRAEGNGYVLAVDRSQVDLHLFQDLVADARGRSAAEPRRVLDLVEGALWLWRGLPLADLVTEPALHCRERVLREEWLAAHTIRVRALFDLGRYDEALAALDELLADYPDDPQLANLTLTCLYRRQRLTEATGFFLTTWRRLRADGDERAAHLLRQHHTALAAAYPAPVVPRPTLVPREVPGDVRGFVGRREQLGMMDSAAVRLLVLDGPGGVGKTTLAVHWAHRAGDRFPDGELFVPMRGVASTGAVVDHVLTGLGQPPDPRLSGRQRERLLRVLLTGRRMLVVLDDVRDADQVRRLTELLAPCLVVVTSRQRLPLPHGVAARRIPVPPMSDGTVNVFLALHAQGPVPDAARLSALCGGLPLLLNVLTGQLAGRSPAHLAELVTRMDRRRLLAVVGAQGTAAAQGESCLTWSYRALSAPERRLFRLLALHPGTEISAEAAFACDGRTPTETLAGLTYLVAANLLEPSDELDRFARHDVLAEFAARCLERDEPDESRSAARERLLDFLTASATAAARMVCPGFVPQPGGRRSHGMAFVDVDEAKAWFGRERTTLTAAVRRAHDAGCHEQVWQLADPMASLLEWAGGAVESTAIRALAVDAARAVGDRDLEASALHRLGTAHLMVNDHEAAWRCLADADDLRGDQVAVLDGLGQLAALRGDTAEALALYHRGIAAASWVEDLAGSAWLHCHLGQSLRAAEQHDEALVHLRRGRALAREAEEPPAESACLAEIGALHRDRGDCLDAIAHCEEALAIAEAMPDLTAAALVCVTLAEISAECRLFDQAVTYGRRGVEILRGTQDLANQARVVEALGDALFQSGEPHEATVTWQQAAELYDHAGLPVLVVRLRGKIDNGRLRGSAPYARAGSDAVLPSLPAVRNIVNGHSEG
jgi:tetratricopeptide (TPR) repeat protein